MTAPWYFKRHPISTHTVAHFTSHILQQKNSHWMINEEFKLRDTSFPQSIFFKLTGTEITVYPHPMILNSAPRSHLILHSWGVSELTHPIWVFWALLMLWNGRCYNFRDLWISYIQCSIVARRFPYRQFHRKANVSIDISYLFIRHLSILNISHFDMVRPHTSCLLGNASGIKTPLFIYIYATLWFCLLFSSYVRVFSPATLQRPHWSGR